MLDQFLVGIGLLAAFVVTHAMALALPEGRFTFRCLEFLGWAWAVAAAGYVLLPASWKLIDPTTPVISGWDTLIALAMLAFSVMSATVARFQPQRQTQGGANAMLSPLILEIAKCSAAWHCQEFGSHMSADHQVRMNEVIEDLVIAALITYEERVFFSPSKYPMVFSLN